LQYKVTAPLKPPELVRSVTLFSTTPGFLLRMGADVGSVTGQIDPAMGDFDCL
jgi:hypothetical protein